MINIKTSYADGVIWFTPYKRVLFWWVKIDVSFSDLKMCCEWLDKNGY